MAKLQGLREMKGRIVKFAQAYPYLVGEALFDELNEVELPESNRRIPKDTHAAEESGTVLGPEIRPGSIKATIAYATAGETNPKSGQPVSEYIIPLHEDLDAFHPNGEAKFLETTLNESERHLGPRIARRAGVDRIRL